MNLIRAARSYVNQMLDAAGVSMKVLLMDKETIMIISMVYAQSEILQKEVFLFELINSAEGKPLKHLTAICLLRMTNENLEALIRELQKPKYGNYYIYFTNTIEKDVIEQLAQADLFDCVRSIQEVYLDYLVISPHLFSLDIPKSFQKNDQWESSLLYRTVEGLTAVLLSLRRQNVTIRYQSASKMAQTLAERFHIIWRKISTFNRSEDDDRSQTVVLIVDRRSDPVTPLLNQWTYQAMIHELIGIKNNRVNLSQVPGITKELEEVIINAEYDEFYANNLYNNYGEIATNIKLLMEEYQEKHKNQSRIESINDMKSFVETYPQFKKLSGTVSKHVTIISELSRLTSLYQLLEVSEVEQNLVSQNDHKQNVQKIREFIENPKIRNEDIIRLLCLYAFRYERQNNDLNALKNEASRHRRFSEKLNQFIEAILDYSSEKYRPIDLFHGQTPIAITRQLFRNLKGVDNVYTQHVPLVKNLIEQLLRGKLKDTIYPLLGEKQSTQNAKPSEIFIYFIGGVTYAESHQIQMMNKQGARIFIGASSIHNFSSFVDEVLAGRDLPKSNLENQTKRRDTTMK